MLSGTIVITALVILVALTFDFINGFHDTANAIAASVSTRALRPRRAIIIAAFFNFLGAMAGTKVAATIGTGIVMPHYVTQEVVLAALIGAIIWNLITWYLGIPSSSSHALIGGLVGAVVAASGAGVLNFSGLKNVFTALLVSPVVGFALGFIVMVILFWIIKDYTPTRINKYFKRLQILSAMFISFSHGSNDAQKSMGIITMALVSGGFLDEFAVPWEVIVACGLAMALGTSAGGWRIIRTMGNRIFKLQPINGFAVDLTASTVILTSSHFGLPISTTHVIASTVMGVGASTRFSAVKWRVVLDILSAWIFTLPACALLAAVSYFLVHFLLFGM